MSEIEICCDLDHPNLVRLVGYAAHPSLLIVQELLSGGSLERQLYTEQWQPNQEQAVKIALDVAQGMAHLHTAFFKGAELEDAQSHDQVIIHRDLKSPNLLLAEEPTVDRPVVVKITDFGLSKDKNLDHSKQTAMMTGCGSVLWMAPEVLLGQVFNEKVDIYSYGMCLLEVVARQLPWTDVCAPGAVALRVTRGERPEGQLARAKDCPEYVKAEECRAAGCEWTKKGAECAHWSLKNTKGKPTPPPSQTPTTSPTFSPTPVPTLGPTPVPTQNPSAAPTGATSTTAAVEPASTTAADEEPETTTTTKVTSTTAAEQTTTTVVGVEETTTSTTVRFAPLSFVAAAAVSWPPRTASPVSPCDSE